MYRRGKQFLAILLMLTLCLSGASMAFAQMGSGGSGHMGSGGHMGGGGMGHGGGHGGGGHHGANNVTVRGTVTAFDADALTITVNVTYACRSQRDLVGQDVTFAIDPNVVVMVAHYGPGTLDDILVDDTVKIMGNVDNAGAYTAYRIMVY